MRRRAEIDLIRADAKAPDRPQSRRRIEHLLSDLRPRTNAEDVALLNNVAKRLPCWGVAKRFDGVALRLQRLGRSRVNAFEQRDGDLVQRV